MEWKLQWHFHRVAVRPLKSAGPGSNWNLECWFLSRGENGVPGENYYASKLHFAVTNFHAFGSKTSCCPHCGSRFYLWFSCRQSNGNSFTKCTKEGHKYDRNQKRHLAINFPYLNGFRGFAKEILNARFFVLSVDSRVVAVNTEETV